MDEDPEVPAPGQNPKARKARQDYESKSRQLKGTNIISRLFFGWISCMLMLGNSCQFDTEDLPRLPDSMHPRHEYETLKKNFNKQNRNKNPGITLLKSILKSYKGSLAILGIVALLITVLTMAAPVLTHLIISYIKQAP